MKKFLIGLISTVGVAAIFLVAAVVALNAYYCYNGVFPMRVWINGTYCTGMTADEVVSMLDASYERNGALNDKISVRTADGKMHELLLKDYGVNVTYERIVEGCLVNETKSFSWLKNIRTPRIYRIFPAYGYDIEVIETKLNSLDWLNENLYRNADKTSDMVSIQESESGGYMLVDKTKNLLLKENAVELICNGIASQLSGLGGSFATIDLSEGENKKLCYRDVPYTSAMKDTLTKWKGIERFQDFKLTYKFGDRDEIVDSDVVADWIMLGDDGKIVFDEENNPVLDESMIEEYIAYLSMTYNTVGVERKFKTTRGDTVAVASGSYGNAIDEKAEYEFLLDAFTNKKGGARVPKYISEAKAKGANDIGDTYIEVDMGSQHMYYYVNGEVVIDTPIVTGNAARGWNTPAKVCFVYFKQKNRVLRGANYATPVKFWMAVDGNIGIHDATWRNEFGSDIYKTNGSHGCINTPLEIMTEMYDMVETGTPVVMFY